jgi:hypothetical protein
MFLLRTARVALPKPTSSLRGSSLIVSNSTSIRSSAFSTTTTLSSGSDYGSGEANTKTERSQATKDSEHPGPAPPSTGGSKKSSSSGGSKGGEKKASSSASKSEDKKASSGGSDKSGGDKPQPKILNTSHPKEGEESEEVKKHNEELKNAREKQSE